MDKETREFLESKFNVIDERFNATDEKFEENKRYFGVVAEGLRTEIQQVAEGHQVIHNEIQAFRREVTEEFKEVRALIKFSYAELDQRIRILESSVQTLGTRLDRLEMGRN